MLSHSALTLPHISYHSSFPSFPLVFHYFSNFISVYQHLSLNVFSLRYFPACFHCNFGISFHSILFLLLSCYLPSHSVMLLFPLPLIIAYPPSSSLSPSSSLCDPGEAAVVIRSVPSDIPSLFVSSAPCEPPRHPLSRIQYALSLELLISAVSSSSSFLLLPFPFCSASSSSSSPSRLEHHNFV